MTDTIIKIKNTTVAIQLTSVKIDVDYCYYDLLSLGLDGAYYIPNLNIMLIEESLTPKVKGQCLEWGQYNTFGGNAIYHKVDKSEYRKRLKDYAETFEKEKVFNGLTNIADVYITDDNGNFLRERTIEEGKACARALKRER